MKAYTSVRFKGFLLLPFGLLLFLGAGAQRRNERNQSGSHGDRGFSNSPGRPRLNNAPQRPTHEITRPERRPPVVRNDEIRHETVRPGVFHSPGAAHAPVVRPADRFPGNSHGYGHPVRVAPAPRYGYYGNGFRYHSYYRPPVYNARNPGWRYAYLPPRRAVITSFPFAYQTINFGGFGYRCYNGTYYRPYNNAFIVVAPPIGLFINVLPFGYRRIYVHNDPYYYYNGTYYDEYEDNYRVVAPPVGAVVESIPQGYETIVIDGETYYKVDGVQYKPAVQENGEIWYEVIKVD